MAKKRAPKRSNGRGPGDGTEDVALDYRHHHARRLNNPTAGNAPEGKVEKADRKVYAYDPHRPPTLRYDATGRADALMARMTELLAKAQAPPVQDPTDDEPKGSLSADEAAELANALRQGQPWLEWAGKREQPAFVVDAPAIHLHERVSARALLRVAARKDVQRSLFGESDLGYSQSVQFYHHAVNWANRLILGDNRAVMASLAQREGLAGKVQMIYIDPPYGIRFKSNFQPEIGRRDVKEIEADLSREMETVRAYRDTWHLGIHSYISYVRECLALALKLLADTGSIFFQIGDENIHLVRNLLDEVFGVANFHSLITIVKTGGTSAELLAGVCDYVLWYSKDHERIKYNQMYKDKTSVDSGGGEYKYLVFPNGSTRPMTAKEVAGEVAPPTGAASP